MVCGAEPALGVAKSVAKPRPYFLQRTKGKYCSCAKKNKSKIQTLRLPSLPCMVDRTNLFPDFGNMVYGTYIRGLLFFACSVDF